jgi:Skp family chaperone for outer membrane proteins
MTRKKQHEQKLQAQLDEWDAEIDKLKARAKNMQADGKLAYEKEIKKLSALKDTASDKLTEFKGYGEDAWEDINIGLHDAINSLDNAFKSATSRLK